MTPSGSLLPDRLPSRNRSVCRRRSGPNRVDSATQHGRRPAAARSLRAERGRVRAALPVLRTVLQFGANPLVLILLVASLVSGLLGEVFNAVLIARDGRAERRARLLPGLQLGAGRPGAARPGRPDRQRLARRSAATRSARARSCPATCSRSARATWSPADADDSRRQHAQRRRGGADRRVAAGREACRALAASAGSSPGPPS